MPQVPVDILKKVCTTDCPRFSEGTCPYSVDEKSICPRVREVSERTCKVETYFEPMFLPGEGCDVG